MPKLPPHRTLAHLPTPVWHNANLSKLLGLELWVKRDDMSAGAAAGNKIRKLEFLLHEAVLAGCHRLITCGGEQSNHARATALCGASLGLRSTLYLRKQPDAPAPKPQGNLLLDRLVGAEIRWITPDQYQQVDAIMQRAKERDAADGIASAVIPEGGSNGLGAMGYVRAMLEIREQLASSAEEPQHFDVIVHACGSGGTAAGTALGGALTKLASEVLAIPVCNDAAYFGARVRGIVEQARTLCPDLVDPLPLTFPEGFQGPAYGVASRAQLEFIRRVARCAGLILDPVYTGKALFGLAELNPRPKRALFIHTGGLPGLLAQADRFE